MIPPIHSTIFHGVDYSEGQFEWGFNLEDHHWEIFLPILLLVIIAVFFFDTKYKLIERKKK